MFLFTAPDPDPYRDAQARAAFRTKQRSTDRQVLPPSTIPNTGLPRVPTRPTGPVGREFRRLLRRRRCWCRSRREPPLKQLLAERKPPDWASAAGVAPTANRRRASLARAWLTLAPVGRGRRAPPAATAAAARVSRSPPRPPPPPTRAADAGPVAPGLRAARLGSRRAASRRRPTALPRPKRDAAPETWAQGPKQRTRRKHHCQSPAGQPLPAPGLRRPEPGTGPATRDFPSAPALKATLTEDSPPRHPTSAAPRVATADRTPGSTSGTSASEAAGGGGGGVNLYTWSATRGVSSRQTKPRRTPCPRPPSLVPASLAVSARLGATSMFEITLRE